MDLTSWIEETTGGELAHLERLPGGNRRMAWTVDVRRSDGSTWELFLRCDDETTEQQDDPFTLWREAAVYDSLSSTRIRIPALVGVHPHRQAMLTERVPGSAVYHEVASTDEGERIAHDLMACLAELHTLEVPDGFPGLSPSAPIHAHVLDHLATWERLYRATQRPDPLVEVALRWLQDSCPEVAAPATVVHGDTGPGNFLFADGRVTALVDWELSHLGDPLEDLAWLSMRSVFEPVPEFPALLQHYGRMVGASVDLDRLRYHRVAVQARVAIIRHRADGDPTPRGDVANGLLSRAVNRRLLVEALSDAVGIAAPRVEPADGADTDGTWLYDAALQTLRDQVLPATGDPLGRARTKSVARILKLLRERDRTGALVRERERDSLQRLLGDPSVEVEDGRHRLASAIRDGRYDLDVLLPHFAMIVADETTLMRGSLGALADRHLPTLDAR